MNKILKNEDDLEKEYNLKSKEDVKIKDSPKNEDNVKKEGSLEMKTHTAPPLRPFVVLVHYHFEFSLELTPFTFPIQFLASPCGIIPRLSELAEFVFSLNLI